jgi:hypothetical protein
MRKFSLSVLLVVLLVSIVVAVLPALAAPAGDQVEGWTVEWHDEVTGYSVDYGFGQAKEQPVYAGDARVIFSDADQPLRAGNAVLVSCELSRGSAGARHRYVLTVTAPKEGVKLVPVAPTVRIVPLDLPSNREVSRSGSAYVFGRPPTATGNEITLELPPGELRTALAGANAYYAAEFAQAGEYGFTVTVWKDGQEVKRETVTIPVTPGNGTWEARWSFERFGVSLVAPGATSAEQAEAYLRKGIASAKVTLRSTGDVMFDPAGSFDLPLDGTPVWTRLSAVANHDMPTGRAEMVTEVVNKQLRLRDGETYETGVGFVGNILPTVQLSNGPEPSAPTGMTAQEQAGGNPGFPILFVIPIASAAALVAGAVLPRRGVEVWLERQGESVLIRRGRRGPGRVRAVVTFLSGGREERQELELGRAESREIEPPEGWQEAVVVTPGWQAQPRRADPVGGGVGEAERSEVEPLPGDGSGGRGEPGPFACCSEGKATPTLSGWQGHCPWGARGAPSPGGAGGVRYVVRPQPYHRLGRAPCRQGGGGGPAAVAGLAGRGNPARAGSPSWLFSRRVSSPPNPWGARLWSFFLRRSGLAHFKMHI